MHPRNELGNNLADAAVHSDMKSMARLAKLALILMLSEMGSIAHAQMPQPMNQPSPSPALTLPPPPAPPPPRIEVPPIPKMDAPPSQPRVNVNPRGSFSDRITNCLNDGTAAGLGPSERAEYSRACANR